MRKNRGKGNDLAVTFGVLDFETDPFKYGRVPFPFACGIYFGSTGSYSLLWGKSVIEDAIREIKRLPTCVLYAHNGGRFDFFYLVEHANRRNCMVRNGRIFEVQIGNVTLRDSWPLMPFALEEYRKTKIDYSIFAESKREETQNKLKIQSYLYDDCKNLWDLIKGFREILGPKDTIGSAAFYQMRQLGIDIQSLNESHDNDFRPYFFGGRVEAFKQGIHHGNYRYLDINSAYPFAMLHNHAHGSDYHQLKRLPRRERDCSQCFISLVADSQGALPVRLDDGSLAFPHVRASFMATGWEVLAGLETGTIQINKILDVWKPKYTINFRPFVDKFFSLKQRAKESGDKIAYLAYKYALNSGYGKFAQNPRDFREYILETFGVYPKGEYWEWETDYGDVSLFSRPNYEGFGFFDVATGASITGFNRAHFWRGVCKAKGLLYGDTDAQLSKQAPVSIGQQLGQWKVEPCPECGKSTRIIEACIAGKKLYGFKYSCGHTKVASKGARLTYAEIKSACEGDTITWKNPAPTFSATLGAQFVKRKIKATE